MEVVARTGDSFWYYSQLFRIRLELIVDSNRDVAPEYLAVGQSVAIPGFVAVVYQVRSGDTIWEIARSRNLQVDAITLLNPGLNPNHLKVRQTIRIPHRVTWRLVQGQQRYGHEVLMRDLRRILNVYPFLRFESIGKSVLGRNIPEVRIGYGSKKVHYNAAFHANEWITTSVVMTFLNDYLLSLTNQTSIRGLSSLPLYRKTSLSVVPMVNPDGVGLVLNGPPGEPWRSMVIGWNNGSTDFTNWKANIRGVDLNDQFPALWEAERARNPKVPGPRDYGGEKPLTEPEAIAMANLTERQNFARVLAFHTQGEEIYWGFENMEPPESEKIVNEFVRVSGYEAVKTLESYAGYKDWFIHDWQRPGFTVELGLGMNPLPISQFDSIYRDALGIFLAGLYM